MSRKRFDLVGELHLVISLRNWAEVWCEADGDVVRVHLGHAAVLRQVGQQGEQVGHHLILRRRMRAMTIMLGVMVSIIM